jgi:hypothetical protein
MVPVGTYVGRITFPSQYLLGIREIEEDEISLTVGPDGTVERGFVHVAHESRQGRLCMYDAISEITGTISGRLSGLSGQVKMTWEEVWRETRTGHVTARARARTSSLPTFDSTSW